MTDEAPSCRCERPRLAPKPDELLPSTCVMRTGERVVRVTLEFCWACRKVRARRETPGAIGEPAPGAP